MSHLNTSRKFDLNLYYIDQQGEDHPSEFFPESATILGPQGHRYLAVREARDLGRFSLVFVDPAEDDDGNPIYYPRNGMVSGVLYQPLHSSVTPADIDGATYAWDDGTHWHFAHCSPGEQIALAARASVFVREHFSHAISSANVKVHEATTALLAGQRVAKLRALVKFSLAAGIAAHAKVVGETLGHFHRDPHDDHLRDIAVFAIDKVLASWAESGKANKALRADLAHVRAAATGARALLVASAAIETRPARAARLEAEKKATEATAPPSTEATQPPATEAPTQGSGA